MEAKKSTVYKRLFLTNIIVVIFLIITLDMYFFIKFYENNKKSQIYVNDKVVYDLNEEINSIADNSEVIEKNIYSDLEVLKDIINFMDTDTISYLESKLDKFSSRSESSYNGIENFVKSSFYSNTNLDEISFIGYKRLEKSSFNSQNQIKKEQLIEEDIENYKNFNGVITDKNSITFIKTIRDNSNLEEKGLMLLKYNFNNISNIINKYENDYDVMLLNSKGYIIYSSDDNYDYVRYKYIDEILEDNITINLDKKYFVSKIENKYGIIAVSKFLTSKINKFPLSLISSLIFIDSLVLIVALSIIYIKLKHLSKRTDSILGVMKEVKNGNLNIKIPISSDNDEINYIAENFNEMCAELDKYIKKIYLSQIEQKKIEMVALQNQINPHFLYNTLESIRMKAICNGDKDVGKMLYTLSFLFRKQVKDKNIISLKDEIEYCNKYMEIFKFRYSDSFTYNIDFPPEFEDIQIIKFTLQPLIENYFIHGIRLGDNDNFINIQVTKEKSDIIITIKDNGKGIPKEKIELIKKNLIDENEDGKSIGIINVHKRLTNEFGKEYGVTFEENIENGVIIKVKIKERYNYV
jgi:two-component system, sensor histidine kinase YesM